MAALHGRPLFSNSGSGGMRNFIRFFKRDDGLTTVEWVVLCAVVLLAALGISNMVLQGADDLGNAVANQMSDAADDVDP
jgi:Flp pilus assembly pilin Flp